MQWIWWSPLLQYKQRTDTFTQFSFIQKLLSYIKSSKNLCQNKSWTCVDSAFISTKITHNMLDLNRKPNHQKTNLPVMSFTLSKLTRALSHLIGWHSRLTRDFNPRHHEGLKVDSRFRQKTLCCGKLREKSQYIEKDNGFQFTKLS